MGLSKVIENLIRDTGHSLWAFQPELWLCGTIVAVLLARLFGLHGVLSPFVVSIVGTAGAIAQQVYMIRDFSAELKTGFGGRFEFFDGLLIYDNLTIFFRLFLLGFALLLFILMRITRVPDKDAASDVYPLVLGATLGMCLMASANHLLVVFLAVEMASVPSYALAGMLKGRRKSSEAALKYAVYGAGAAGVMLYGISLVAGVLGTVHIPTLASRLSEINWSTLPEGEMMALALGGLMLMVGLAFKLSAVPFHFWAPDVFEGATAEIGAFLSVASKAAALALLVRVAVGMGHLPHENSAADAQPTAALSVSEDSIRLAKSESLTPTANQPSISGHDGLNPVRSFASKLIAFLAVITCTFGNLAAYGQTNIKRMLAYSTIAHAGYMMMPIAAAVDLLSDPARHGVAHEALGSLLVYAVTYLFMNLGAFAIVAFVRNQYRSEEIADYAGLIRTSPAIAVCFVLILLSLVGLPPLAGFAGKFVVFQALIKSQWYTLLIIAAANTALSLFYYLRVVKVMCMDGSPEAAPPARSGAAWLENGYAIAITVPVVVLGVYFSWLINLAADTVRTAL